MTPNENENQSLPPTQENILADMPQPVPCAPAGYIPLPIQTPAPKHVYTTAERVLLLLALLTGILYNRLVFANLFKPGWALFSGAFWACYLVIFYGFNWEKAKHNAVGWAISGLLTLLCAWNLIFDYNSSFGRLAFVVIPCVCMGHAVFVSGGYSLKQVGQIALDWLLGWVYKPFFAIHHLFGAGQSAMSSGKNATTKRVLAGIGIALPVLLVILPLLSGADLVFGYYMEKILHEFRLSSFVGHLLVVLIAAILFYSFFWSLRYAKPLQSVEKKENGIDFIISSIVLGTVLAVYALFCAVQFTYLFARAGLPDGMSYSEYAVAGFWQLIVIAAINLFLFAIFLRFGQKRKAMTGLLVALLAVTAIMLVSGALRLKLYTDAYGLTWLRLLSAWFICYLGIVIVISAVRLFVSKIPLMAVCAIFLLTWFTALGYANPDALVVKYNLAAAKDASAWIAKNEAYILWDLSDDAFLALAENYSQDPTVQNIRTKKGYRSDHSYSLSSRRAQKYLQAE